MRHAELSLEQGPRFANTVLQVLKAIWGYAAWERQDVGAWPANFTQTVNWNTQFGNAWKREIQSRKETQP